MLARPRVLWRILRGQPRAGTLAQRLQTFYAPQALHYDETRAALLHGRRLLKELVRADRGAVVVELGAGTGASLDLLGPAASACGEIHLVDLCAPLLEVARRKAAGLDNVRIAEADATRYQPGRPADLVVFSYSLTMIPDWFLAIDNAFSMLRPGGRIAVTDFHVGRRDPPPGLVRHGVFSRHFWPLWFGHDGVRPNPDHVPYLLSRFDVDTLVEDAGPVPGLPFVRVPYYAFVGRKPLRSDAV
ncbi:MAG: class I SAM-dependent methyltransferase [Betaproteobacteria bacterium]|nr:class I SAM-dependent methyltransferase [Betaproteobacteria bacterium]